MSLFSAFILSVAILCILAGMALIVREAGRKAGNNAPRDISNHLKSVNHDPKVVRANTQRLS